jgi:hypothetical protein
VSDREGAVAALKSDLNARGVVLEPQGSGSHAPVVERKIREIKECMRGIFNTLPFKLPHSLIKWLAFFAVNRINLFPHRGAYLEMAPREVFLGRKTNFKVDARIAFGAYAEAIDPYSDNTMRPRTTPCIALCPTGNTTGSVQFLSLVTGSVITRDQFTELPMPDSVINHLNVLAAKQSALPDAPLSFAMGSLDIDGPYELHQGVELVPDEEVLITDEPFPSADNAQPDPDIISVVQRADVPSDSAVPQPFQASLGSLTEEPIHSLEPDQHHSDTEPISVHIESEPTGGYDSESEDPASYSADIPSSHDTPVVQQDSPPTRHNDESVVEPTNRYFTRQAARGTRVHWHYKDETPTETSEPSAASTSRSRREGKRAQAKTFNISVKKAMKSMPRSAIDAMFKELLQIHSKGVIPPAPRSLKQKKKAIRSFMFLKEKYLPNGTFERLKARLVGGGHMQDRTDVLYDDVSSPTASMPFVFTVAALAALERRHVVTVDITGAYLNADMSSHEILMDLDPLMSAMLIMIDPSYQEHQNSNGTITVQLNKALYGCIESAKLWYDLLSATLLSTGYVQNPSDRCVFNKVLNGVQCTAVVYVDDIFITCADEAPITELTTLLKDRFHSITVRTGKVHSYLGMQWDFSTVGEVVVTMKKYVEDLLLDAGVTGLHRTPASESLFQIRDAPMLETKEREKFHSLVAKVLYLAKRTRPDLLLATSFLTTRVQSPDTDDARKLHRMLGYLNGTKSFGIVLRPADVQSLTLDAFIDASYGVHADGKSHSGMIIALSAGPLFVKSSKQKIVTKSSTEAELVAFSDMCSNVIWCRDFLTNQGYNMPPARVYQDNQSAIALEEKGTSSSERTRHVHIRHFWVRDRIESGDMQVAYLPTDLMIADILTKPLQGDKFIEMRNQLLNWKNVPINTCNSSDTPKECETTAEC